MPSSTLVAAAEASPPLRRRHRRPFESVTLRLPVFRSLVLPPRDWADGLPPELLSCILHRLDHVQIMLGADKVCRSWRRAARDEPELWCRIEMRGYKALSYGDLVDLNQMAVEAVRRSQEQCQAFSGEGDLHNDFIHFLGNHSPLLKRLILVSCGQLSGRGFMQAITGFPLLEELHLSKCWSLQRVKVFEVIAKECLCLKHLTVCDEYSVYYYIVDNDVAMAIAGLRELRSLQLTHNKLSIQGLAAILDNCLHLKLLDIHNCYNIHMTPEMEARIRTKKLLMNYSSDGRRGTSDERGSPTIECETCLTYFKFEHNEEWYWKRGRGRYPNDKNQEEAMLISAVCELRSLELYRINDLTSKGLEAILDKCPHLELLDVWNCLNIALNNNNALLGAEKWPRIKTKKLTTKLLMDCSTSHTVFPIFNPEALDIRNCRDIAMNSCYGRCIIKDSTLGAKYKRLKLRKIAIKYHRMTKKMKTIIEYEYMDKLPGGIVDYTEFEGVKFNSSVSYIIFNPNHYRFEPDYRYMSECSTCLMFEHLAERWGVMDFDDSADYYDSSYDLGIYDEIEFQVHDRMVAKRFRKYLKWNE